MNSSELMALLMLCTAASFTPGPNTTLSTALAVNHGLRSAMVFVAAVPVGWGMLFGVCAAGLGSLVQAVPVLRWAVTLAGVGYLLWLAAKLAGFALPTLRRSGAEGTPLPSGPAVGVSFGQGVLLQFLNIKAWMLAMTLVAGWLAGRPDFWQRFALVLPIILCFALASNMTYALLGSLLRHWLAQGQRLLMFNRAMALVLLLTAVWMLQL